MELLCYCMDQETETAPPHTPKKIKKKDRERITQRMNLERKFRAVSRFCNCMGVGLI